MMLDFPRMGLPSLDDFCTSDEDRLSAREDSLLARRIRQR